MLFNQFKKCMDYLAICQTGRKFITNSLTLAGTTMLVPGMAASYEREFKQWNSFVHFKKDTMFIAFDAYAI